MISGMMFENPFLVRTRPSGPGSRLRIPNGKRVVFEASRLLMVLDVMWVPHRPATSAGNSCLPCHVTQIDWLTCQLRIAYASQESCSARRAWGIGLLRLGLLRHHATTSHDAARPDEAIPPEGAIRLEGATPPDDARARADLMKISIRLAPCQILSSSDTEFTIESIALFSVAWTR